MAEFLTIFRKLVFLSKKISCEAAKHGEVNSSVYGLKSTGAGELVISLSIHGIYLYIWRLVPWIQAGGFFRIIQM